MCSKTLTTMSTTNDVCDSYTTKYDRLYAELMLSKDNKEELYEAIGNIIDSNYIPDKFKRTIIHVHLHPLFNNKKFKRHLIANLDKFSKWADLEKEINAELDNSLERELNTLFRICKIQSKQNQSPYDCMLNLVAFYACFKLGYNYCKIPIRKGRYIKSLIEHFDKFETLQQIQNAIDFAIAHDTTNVEDFLNNHLSQ